MTGSRRSVASDVRALARIAVAARLVAGQLRRWVIGVEAVVLRAEGVVAFEPGVLGLVVDVDPVAAGAADVVATHHVAHYHVKSHADRVPLGVTDRVAGEHISVAAVDLDAGALLMARVRDAVSSDHVSVTGGDIDAESAVSNAAVA